MMERTFTLERQDNFLSIQNYMYIQQKNEYWIAYTIYNKPDAHLLLHSTQLTGNATDIVRNVSIWTCRKQQTFIFSPPTFFVFSFVTREQLQKQCIVYCINKTNEIKKVWVFTWKFDMNVVVGGGLRCVAWFMLGINLKLGLRNNAIEFVDWWV